MSAGDRERIVADLRRIANVWEDRGSADIKAVTERLTCELMRKAADLLGAAEATLTAAESEFVRQEAISNGLRDANRLLGATLTAVRGVFAKWNNYTLYAQAVVPSNAMREPHKKSRTEMKYRQEVDGEWIQPVRRNYKLACCDCGLCHRVDFRIKSGRVQFRAVRNSRSTAAKRRHVSEVPKSWTN